MRDLFLKKKKEKKYYVYNIFRALSQQIISSRLLRDVIGGQKNNFNSGFKLEHVTTYHVRFVMKILYTQHFLKNDRFKQLIHNLILNYHLFFSVIPMLNMNFNFFLICKKFWRVSSLGFKSQT